MSRCASAWRRGTRSCGEGGASNTAVAEAAVITATTTIRILESPFIAGPHVAKVVPPGIIAGVEPPPDAPADRRPSGPSQVDVDDRLDHPDRGGALRGRHPPPAAPAEGRAEGDAGHLRGLVGRDARRARAAAHGDP